MVARLYRRVRVIRGIARLGCLLAFACSAGPLRSEPVSASHPEIPAVGQALQELIDAGRMPGILTVVMQDDRVIHFDARGFADIEREVFVSDATIFRWYSMTKPITCAALLLLVESGEINLDDPVARYLPEFKQMQVRTAAGLRPAVGAITIRNLLTHTSGLGYGPLPSAVSDSYRAAGVSGPEGRLGDWDLAEHVRVLAGLPLLADPGTAWHYGESIGVLGRVIEVVSGKSLGEFLAEQLFEPLGMLDTGFHVPAHAADRLAALYVADETGRIQLAPETAFGGDYTRQPRLEYGGAGLVGTAGDYLRFARMLLNGGELEGARILQEESVAKMLSNHLPGSFPERPLAGLSAVNPWLGARGLGFGFGGYVVVDADLSEEHFSAGEYSWGGWARTNFWIDPERALVGLILTQVIPSGQGLPTREILRGIVYGDAE